MKLLHVIAGLELGGAQITLQKLLSGMDKVSFPQQVVSLTSIGAEGILMQRIGVPVFALGMRPGVPDPAGLFRLALLLRRIRPDLIQTWMYHSDLMGGLAAKLAWQAPVIWGVRFGCLDRRWHRAHTRYSAKACATLSRWLPRRIICPSHASLTWHAGIGYERDKFVVIPNGFDVGAFHPDQEARRSVREELGISPGALLVGLIARVDRQKDHRTFLRAAALVHASMDHVHFLLCGSGASWENRELTRWIDDPGLRQRLHLLGERQDISRVTAALDVASLSSTGEAFGNVIAEAMACGVPCACTEVGDLSELVGDTGRVAPPEDVGALANALKSLLALSREERLRMGLAARARVEEHYSVREMVARYQGVYLEVVSQS